MNFTGFFIGAVLILLASFAAAIAIGNLMTKKIKLLTPTKVIFAGVVLAAVVLFFPVYMTELESGEYGGVEAFFLSVYSMIRLFIVDGDLDLIMASLDGASEGLARAYMILFSVLFVLAPILTFSFVLSFFKNVSAYWKYFTHFFRETYIFSELNEKSVTLAKSLYDGNKKRFFIFTDVFETDDEKSYELRVRAEEIGAVCFKKDITTVKFAFHSKKSALHFFTIGEDQSESISQTLKIIEKYKTRENTNLYVFSVKAEAEMLLSNAFSSNSETKIRVRRVNEVQSLIMRTLYETGYDKIFSKALPNENGEKVISCVVVGMGHHGTEMTKALAWFCQMTGYRVYINSFDLDEKADVRFKALCPELMAGEHNHKFDDDGDARYSITVHPGTDVTTETFFDTLRALPPVTYAFVALGDDERNISTALSLRTLFASLGYSSAIQAVVYNSDKKEALTGITNFKKQSYDIDFIGDTRSSYSEAVILHSDIEREALSRHLVWGDESEFWQYDYNYKSSLASAIHRAMKKKCAVAGIEKAPADRTNDELWGIRRLEHARWNAYMRSEGYSYGGTTERRGRNDLGKLHNCLVTFDELPLKEQEKDDD